MQVDSRCQPDCAKVCPAGLLGIKRPLHAHPPGQIQLHCPCNVSLHQRVPAADNVLGKQMLLDEHVREKLYDLRVFPPVGEDREGWDQNQAADFLGMVQEAALLALDHTALVSHTLYRQPS